MKIETLIDFILRAHYILLEAANQIQFSLMNASFAQFVPYPYYEERWKMNMESVEKYAQVLRLDEFELKSRLAYFEIKEEDFQQLASLQEFARKYTEDITEELYELIIGHPETRLFFPDTLTLAKVKQKQNEYFKHLFSGKYDLDYVMDRLRVGATHERLAMPPKWYLGAYRRYIQLIYKRLVMHFQNQPEAIEKAISSIQKIIFFDMALAIDVYIAAHLESMTRHQAAIRELSTPVIKVYERILLLPIIGTVDTQRATQIMETVLLKVIQEQAKVIIIDIAGVAVVDTKVAEHLIRTTASVRLLGSQTILTGISAEVAKTIVHLGIDISSMHTHTSLSEGIEFALELLGKKIESKSKKDRKQGRK